MQTDSRLDFVQDKHGSGMEMRGWESDQEQW
jgi:hypothetical protein